MAPTIRQLIIARWPLLLFIITTLLVTLNMVTYFKRLGSEPVLNENEEYFGIMLDAGSTGSRVHVFKYVRVEDDLILDSEVFVSIKPGLSAFKNDPMGGAKSLVPLLDKCLEVIPPSKYASTPINLKATAGLRLLPRENADALLKAVRELFATYPFQYDPSDAVEIIDGTDEGIYGWVTINYLLDKLGKNPQETAAILDLGGGSTQIALAVTDPKHPEIDIDGDKHRLFAYSHLGFGLMAARAAIITFDVDKKALTKASEEELVHSCFAPGVTVEYKYGEKTYVATGHANHSYETCRNVASSLIKHPSGSFNSSKSHPTPVANQPIYALSYYRDRAVDLGLIEHSADHAVITLHDFVQGATNVCGLSPAAVQKKYPRVNEQLAPYLCLDLCYIISLLEDGFKIHRQAPLNLASKIRFRGEAVESAWPLGASLLYLSELM